MPAAPNTPVQTYVLVHGAYGGGWLWRDVAAGLRARGHGAWTPTLTGLGERAHLLSGQITVETHILDVVGLITAEELGDVILVGHSYGGMVVTGVVDRMPDRIRHVVYLDALVPEDGDTALPSFHLTWRTATGRPRTSRAGASRCPSRAPTHSRFQTALPRTGSCGGCARTQSAPTTARFTLPGRLAPGCK